MDMRGRVLIVAGSDSSGGAGIQADIKTVTALGGYAMTAVTAITVQNTQGVEDILPVPAETVAAQIYAVLDDIGADVVKIGMLHSADVIEAVADALPENLPIVLDPVMVAKGGTRLLDQAGVEALRERLMPRATIFTPNLPEAEVLLNMRLGDVVARRAGARGLIAQGPQSVLLKGGHVPGSMVTDLFSRPGGVQELSSPRIDTKSTHGTGCTLASAIATFLAQGYELAQAVDKARAYVADAIRTAPGLGQGHGPLNHAVWAVAR